MARFEKARLPSGQQIVSGFINNLGTMTAIVIGGVWMIYLGTHGAELSQDSLHYIKSASFMRGGDHSATVTVWPPLFPFVLSLAMAVWAYPATAASWLVGALMLLTLVLLARLLKRVLAHPLFETAFVLAFAALPSVWESCRYVWSECLMAPLVLGFFLALHRYHDTRRTRFFLAAAALAAGVALTKYLGYAIWVPLWGAAAVGIWSERSLGRRLRIGAAAVGSVLPSLAWALRNRAVDGTFHGHRGNVDRPAMAAVHRLIKTLQQDFALYVLLVLIAAVIFSALYWFWRWRGDMEHTDRSSRASWRLQADILLFLAVFFPLLVYATSTSNVNFINTRYLVPLYPLFFVPPAVVVRELEAWAPARRGLRFGVTFVMLFAVALLGVVHLAPTSKLLSQMTRTDRKHDAYLTLGFEKSKTAARLRSYLTTVMRSRERLLVSALYNRRLQRHHLGYGLFLREAVFDTDALGEVRFENLTYPTIAVSRDYLTQKSEVDLHFEAEGEQRTLLFRNHRFTRTLPDLLRSLEQMMKAHRLPELLFVVMKPLSEKEGMAISPKAVSAALRPGMVLRQTRVIDAFTIYLFALAEGRGDPSGDASDAQSRGEAVPKSAASRASVSRSAAATPSAATAPSSR